MTWKPVESLRLYRLFYPQIAVIVTSSYAGRVGAMPAIWAMPLSFIPPLVAVSIQPQHATHRLVEESGYFALNWIHVGHSHLIRRLISIKADQFQDKLSAAGFHVCDGKSSPIPIIQEASAALECRVMERKIYGDHDLIVGECLAAYACEDFSDYWQFKSYSPTLYLGSEDGDSTKPAFTTITTG